MSPMVTAALGATLLACVYCALIAMHVLAIRGGSPPGSRYRPRAATWLAAWLRTRDDLRRGRVETAATRRLLAGTLDQAAYRAAMTAMAAQDALAHPIDVTRRAP